MDLFSFIECAKQSQSLKGLFDLLVTSASEQGFSQVAYGALSLQSHFLCQSIYRPR